MPVLVETDVVVAAMFERIIWLDVPDIRMPAASSPILMEQLSTVVLSP
jgi:hypothetical protein